MGDLTFRVIEAKDIFYRGKSANPYIVLRIVGDYGTEYKTQPQLETHSPKFDAEFKWKLRRQNIKVRLTAKHKNKWLSDQDLGTAEVDVSVLKPETPGEMWITFPQGFQVRIWCCWKPDYKLQHDLSASRRKAELQKTNATISSFIMSGGTAVIDPINKAVDKELDKSALTSSPKPEVVYAPPPMPVLPPGQIVYVQDYSGNLVPMALGTVPSVLQTGTVPPLAYVPSLPTSGVNMLPNGMVTVPLATVPYQPVPVPVGTLPVHNMVTHQSSNTEAPPQQGSSHNTMSAYFGHDLYPQLNEKQ
eukprot:TRINITY_DN1070_c0_g1_i1.p1 TRINITY_DN1070_c0_g1~~TRINITY_DN1070_c0_g1_i1.p1  ORF type:complete len:303 (+),score=54.35 TRINITY_DN1070_c0_g1_i1:81-989(+)